MGIAPFSRIRRFLSRRRPTTVRRAPGLADYGVQLLEARHLLAIPVPPTIDPAAATQFSFGPDISQHTVAASSPGAASRLFKFAMDGTGFAVNAQFQIGPTLPSPGTDAALALYDEDGNLIASADAAAAINPGAETLTADIESARPYVLGLFFAPSGPPVNYFMRATTGEQVVNAPVATNPSTGVVVREANAGDDLFSSPADVDYYPLHLLNGGPAGTVTVTPAAPGVSVSATLFRRGRSSANWFALGSATDTAGGAVTLPLTPTTQQNLTDNDFLLAVAPAGLSSAASAYRIDVTAAPVLGPATVSPSSPGLVDLLTPPATALGTSGVTYDGSIAPGGQQLFKFRAAGDGLATLAASSASFQPVLSVFGEDGATLLDVVSRSGSAVPPATATATLPVTSGAAYLLRVGDVGGDAGGAFQLRVSQPYVPQVVPLGGVATVSNIPVGAGLPASFYRFQPASGTDLLVLELAAGSGGPARLQVSGNDIPPVVYDVPAGQKRLVPVDVGGDAGPFDAYVIGTAPGVSSATLRAAQLDLPNTLGPDDFAPGQLSLAGDVSLPTQPIGAFGTRTGVSFFQIFAGGGNSVFTAAGSGGAMPLLAHYRQQGTQMKLVGFTAPDAAGVATHSSPLTINQLHGVAAFSIGFDGGNLALSVNGPDLVGVGVGMVPDLQVQPPQYASLLKIETVTLESESWQHLWRTILPFNLLGPVPTVTFEPGGADLAVTINVLWGDGPLAGQPIGSPVQTTAGQPTTFPLAATLDALKGRTVVFRVAPRPGQLGDGVYTLRMNAPTSNPLPFLIHENAWRFAGTLPSYVGNDGDDVGIIPEPSRGPAVVDIVQNQFGDGQAQGNFTSSTPNTLGSLDFYRFWAITRGPVSVRTVPIDPAVNTTLQLYRARLKSDGTLDYIGQISDVGPSRDWFPAHRAEIDAQTYVNNFETIDYDFAGDAIGHPADPDPYKTRGGMYFVVVKNEEGTHGRYRIEVDAPTFPPLGGTVPPAPDFFNSRYTWARNNRTTYIDPVSGGASNIRIDFTQDFPEFLGYYPVQLPDAHVGPLNVTSQFGSRWNFDLFRADGTEVPGTEVDGASNTTAEFTVDPGPQVVYLRVKEQGANPDASSSVNVSAQVNFRPGTVFPPATQPASPVPRLLPTTPTGDGTVTDTMTASGQVKQYIFAAPSNTITVNVVPQMAGGIADVDLRWAVYVDGVLRAWDNNLVSGGELIAASTTTTLALPGLIEPVIHPEFTWDHARRHNVVVYATATGAPQNGGNFLVSVDSAATLPARNTVLRMDPRLSNAQGTLSQFGTSLARLIVPDYTTGNVTLAATLPGGAAGTAIRYQLYDSTGNLVSAKQQSTSAADPDTVTFSVDGSVGGGSYYLRVWHVNRPTDLLQLTATAPLPKALALRPPADKTVGNPSRAAPDPEGNYVASFSGAVTNLGAVSFWVGSPGMAHFDVLLQNGTNAYVAVFRGVIYGDKVPQPHMFLVDYVNDANNTATNHYPLDVWLDPGMYVLEVVRQSAATTATAIIDIDLPDYPLKEVVLDPNFGDNGELPLLDLDDPNFSDPTRQDLGDDFGRAVLTEYRTQFYHVLAPVGSKAGMQAFAVVEDKGAQPSGSGVLNVWDKSAATGQFLRYASPDSSINLAQAGNDSAFVAPGGNAEPLHEYWIGFHRRQLFPLTRVWAHFEVPFSGTPDLEVQKIDLTPDDGETRVDVYVRNLGFAPAFTSHARFRYSDSSNTPQTWTESNQWEFTLGALGERVKVFAWPPKNPADDVEYFTDVLDEREELDETNNEKKRELSEVDPHRPVATLTLADPSLDGNPDANVWGRFVSSHTTGDQTRNGVLGVTTDVVISVSDADGSADLFGGDVAYPAYNPAWYGYEQAFFLDDKPTSYLKFFDFGRLFETTPQNPNVIRVTPKDRWGLRGAEVQRTIQVVRYPGWLDNDHSSIEWDEANKRYDIHFGNRVVDKGGTLEQLVGSPIPFIGGKENRFLAEINSDTTATTNPAAAVAAPVTAHVLMKIVGETVFEETWSGGDQPTEHFEIEANVQVDPLTLDASFLAVTFRLVDMDVFNFESPEIPLFAYGVPGVASINANVSFTLDVGFNAAVTVSIDPAVLADPLKPPSEIGMASPTYIEPFVDAGAKFAGEIEILGFDIAELSGTIHFKLNIAFGLPTPTNEWVDFEDFFSNACLDLTGELYGNIAAEVLGFEVFSFDTPSLHFDFTDDCDVVKGSVSSALPPPHAVAGGATPGGHVDPLPADAEKIPAGNAPVGPMRHDPRPNLVIDYATGGALYLQVVDTDASPAVVGNLAFSKRNGFGGAWSALQTLTDGAHAANPVLALAPGAAPPGGMRPAVVAYQGSTLPGAAGQTRNAFLNSQEIQYRYFDGLNWQAVKTLAVAGYDSDPVLAFNAAGLGVLAWVHNKNTSPISSAGVMARSDNEIMVSRWDPAAREFGAPIALTTDSVADAKPAVYVDENGKLYVVWLKDSSGGANYVSYSTYVNSWSAPAELPAPSLPQGGRVGGLAIGNHGPGTIDVLLSHRRTLLDGPSTAEFPNGSAHTVESRFFNRSTTLAGFGQPAPLETVTEGANYSFLRATHAPDGALIAYWQHSDGQVNEVFASRKSPAGGPWSQPFRATSGDDLEVRPTLAVDVQSGQHVYQVLYEAQVARGDDPGPATLDPSVGAPAAGGVGSSSVRLAPELSFDKGIFFPFASDELTAGTQAVAHARIINRGTAGDQVRVEYFRTPLGGSRVKVGEQVVYLGPGNTLELSPAFTILPGSATYSIQLTALGGTEVVTTNDNYSEARVTGRADLAVVSLTSSPPNPVAGQSVSLSAEVRNLGSVAVGQFPVSLILGDPDLMIAFKHGNPNVPVPQPTQLGFVMVPGLGANASTTVNFNWTLPGGGGDFVLTAIADQSLTPIAYAPIDESIESNNDRQLLLRARGDAAVVPPAAATVLNYSGVDNVAVSARLRNNGSATLHNVHVRLLWSVDNGGYVEQGNVVIPTMPPGETITANFIADGLAGVNRYRILVDPDLKLSDTDRSNNVVETTLVLQGLPDLRPLNLSLNPSTSSPTQGDPLVVNALVANLGIAPARDVLVEVFATNATYGRMLVGSLTIDALAVLSVKTVSIAIDSSKLVGETEIRLVVDRLERILETSELNNAVAVRFNFRPQGLVRGRHVFYNRSTFDGNNPAATPADDNAIATNKFALLPGGVASFNNVTSYSRGINGVMIDVDLRGRTPVTADFAFRVGNDDNPSAWGPAPQPSGLTIRRGAGAGGSDRITLIWPDRSITNTWLQITMLATANTGLAVPDVFYFGNLVGEFGNGSVSIAGTLAPGLLVNTLDLALTKRKISAALVPITEAADFNRDGRVTSVDLLIVRTSQGAAALRLVTAPASVRIATSEATRRISQMAVASFIDPPFTLQKEADALW